MKDTVLITGSSSGIGKEYAKIFANKNCNLVLTSTKIEDLLKVKEELKKNNSKLKIEVFAKDLSKPDAAISLYNDIKKENINVDILVNNAGFGTFGKLTDVDIKKQTDLVMVNINALMQLTYLYAKDMSQRKKGKILNVASIAAFAPGPYMSTYYASKAFVLSFSEAVAQEFKNDNISVSCLCPGPTATNFEKTARLQKSYMFKKLKITTPEYVAKVGYNALMNNKSLVVAGFSNKLLTFCSRFFTKKFTARLTKYVNLGKLKNK